jgi:hypothetical protein
MFAPVLTQIGDGGQDVLGLLPRPLSVVREHASDGTSSGAFAVALTARNRLHLLGGAKFGCG